MEPTAPNPFEPPRTTDLDARSGAAPDDMIVSEKTLDELAAAAPWISRLYRLTALSIAIQVFSYANLARRFGTAAITGTTVLVAAVGIMLSVLFLTPLRRYAAASGRLRDGDDDAVGSIIAAQLSYLKLAGRLTAVGLVLYIVWLALGITSGRWLAWVHA
jgi:hypothetical protein